MIHALHSTRRWFVLLHEAALVVAACLGMAGLLAGCGGANKAAEQQTLAVAGMVILPDSTALFGAEISTDPPTGYVSTDEAGRFWVALPRPATYTFIATHPDGRYRDMEGRITEVTVGFARLRAMPFSSSSSNSRRNCSLASQQPPLP